MLPALVLLKQKPVGLFRVVQLHTVYYDTDLLTLKNHSSFSCAVKTLPILIHKNLCLYTSKPYLSLTEINRI